MSNKLSQKGFTQNYFPFTQKQLQELKNLADKASELSLDKRKNIFASFPKIKLLFAEVIKESDLDIELSEYCFFIEKTEEKNWTLLFHRDMNLPKYLGILEEKKDAYLQRAWMFRLCLDGSDRETGAMKVKVGSHLKESNEIEFIETKEGEVVFFRPLLLHGSNKMTRPHNRRVFQALCVEKDRGVVL